MVYITDYHLSLEDSISEIVADSCDQILMDESVRDKIAKTDSKLFGQIKHFVKDLVDRFKKAVIGMEESASPAARLTKESANARRNPRTGLFIIELFLPVLTPAA